MASLRKEKDRGRSGWRLRIYLNRQRKSLWLGPISKRAADAIARHVDELVRAHDANVSPSAEADSWVKGLDGRIRKTLTKWGLVEASQLITQEQKLCGPFFEAYISDRTDIKAATQTKYRQAAKWFTDHLGEDRPLSSITPAEIDRWRRWMVSEGLAQATANKHAKRVKKLFAEAVRARIITQSPAADCRIGGEVNRERDHYISRAETQALLDKCDTEWAMIVGLCRYAGFRCPTEVLGLTWADVQWAESRLRIDSVKTDRKSVV